MQPSEKYAEREKKKQRQLQCFRAKVQALYENIYEKFALPFLLGASSTLSESSEMIVIVSFSPMKNPHAKVKSIA